MTIEPSVLIVILNWNQRDDTLACLRSLEKSTFTNCETIVVDNGSEDGSQAAIQADFPKVKLLKQSTNRGCAGGRNVGALYGLKNGFSYVLFLDNDTIVAPDFLSRLVSVAESDRSTGILGPKIYFLNDPQRIWAAGSRVDLCSGDCLPMRHGEVDARIPESPYQADYVPGCCILARREVFDRVGLFDEDYFIYFEDTDWCVRATRAGYRIVVVPDSILWHKESRSMGGSYSSGKVYYMTRNQLMFVSKVLPKHKALPLVIRLLTNHAKTVAVQSIKPSYACLRKQRDARLRAMIDFMLVRYGETNGSREPAR